MRGAHEKYNPGEVLEYIARCWVDNHFPPSLREICIACRISSVFVARYILKKLEKEGSLILLPNVSRGIIPAGISITVPQVK